MGVEASADLPRARRHGLEVKERRMEKEVALTRTDIWSEFDESADIYEVTNTRAVAGLGVSLSHSALECDKPSLQIVFQGDSSGICACLQRH